MLRLSLPPGTDISLTGPTGFPVLLPRYPQQQLCSLTSLHCSPPGLQDSSPTARLHYHVPSHR